MYHTSKIFSVRLLDGALAGVLKNQTESGVNSRAWFMHVTCQGDCWNTLRPSQSAFKKKKQPLYCHKLFYIKTQEVL